MHATLAALHEQVGKQLNVIVLQVLFVQHQLAKSQTLALHGTMVCSSLCAVATLCCPQPIFFD
jgi:hypothetical protein